MEENKTKIKCNLVTRGTDKVRAAVTDDLSIPDPDPVIGKQIIDEAMIDKDEENDQ